MKRLTFLTLLLAAGTLANAQTTWKNDKAHSQLKFNVTHMGIDNVSGAFTDFDVTIEAKKPDFSDARFCLTAKAASIYTGVELRDKDLRSADFFDTGKYPALSFVSTGVRRSGNNRYKLTGKLTMHGITNLVTMDLWYRGTIINPMSKADDAGFRLTGVVSRPAYKLGEQYPETMLSEDIRIEADGEFSKSR
jgi:polyisoprenoid-binding protein YceI